MRWLAGGAQARRGGNHAAPVRDYCHCLQEILVPSPPPLSCRVPQLIKEIKKTRYPDELKRLIFSKISDNADSIPIFGIHFRYA
jgi:hypothetical protein